jgi:TusA-related sulfurtransferase
MATGTLEAVVRDRLEIPSDAKRERLDVRNMGPPKPLKETLERLEAMDDDMVLVQLNDRDPQFLYPKLIDRGYEYDTVETDKAVVTGIWKS